MAQQIVIDIVAETKKLTQGIDEANKELGGMSKGLKTAATAAAGLASAFVLKQGVTFLKQGIDEAKDAALTMKQAETAFGKGSAALKQITSDAEKFGKQLAIDNDDIIKLSTQLGSRLPQDVQASSAQIVKIAKDVEAFTAGAVSAEAVTTKLAKAFADGELKATELQKIFPGLEQATYDQAEALSAAGKNQDALNLLIEAGSKKYDDAAAKNTTATQRFETALADFKETLGTKVLPFLEKVIDMATKMIEVFDSQPKILQNVELALLGIVAVGGPLLGFLASAKTAMVTLGLVSEGAALGINLIKVALAGLGIGLAIAAIVLLIQNWDTVKKAADDLWQKIKEVFGNIKDWIINTATAAKDWLEKNWPLILGVLTGPFGLFVAFLVTHKEEVTKKLTDMWNGIKEVIGTIVEIIKVSLGLKFLEMFNDVVGWVIKIRDGVIEKFTSLKDSAIDQFNKLKDAASTIWNNIKGFITDVATNIKNKMGEVFGFMVQVGKDIANGIMQGLTSMTFSFGSFLKNWINANIPSAVRTILKISSPSKVMEEIGKYTVQGLYKGMGVNGPVGIQMPQLNIGGAGAAGINITINAGLGTDPYTLGRTVSDALKKYGHISTQGVY